MNVYPIDNRNYLPTDYKSVVKNISEILPAKEEELVQNQDNFMEDENVMSDKQRELLVGYIGYQSKVDRIDIYLKGSTSGEVGYDGVLPSVQNFNDTQNKMKITDVYA